MLLTIILLIVICVIGCYFAGKAYDTWKEVSLGIVAAIAGIAAFMLLIGYCVSISSNYGFPQKFEAEKATIKQMKDINADFEKIRLAEKAASLNGELATLKYWNKTFFGDTIPDEIDQLEFIK